MCFPGKRQKDNFSEPKPERKDTKADTTGPNLSSPPAPAPPSEPTVTESPDTIMSAPRVAIVIYSLYGHITKRMSLQ